MMALTRRKKLLLLPPSPTAKMHLPDSSTFYGLQFLTQAFCLANQDQRYRNSQTSAPKLQVWMIRRSFSKRSLL